MTTATETNIVNDALVEIGQDIITSLDQGTAVTRVCKEIFENERDAFLEEHPWKFAVKRATLSKLNEVPDHEYSYVFALPEDFISMVEVANSLVYEIEDNKLLTNESTTVQIKYIYRNTSYHNWSPSARAALAARIGAKLAPKLTSNREGVKERMETLYDMRMRKAKNMDAQSSGKPVPKRPSTFLDVRA
jgi:hypothetical protein